MEASALIKQARARAGLTQAELAERAGVKQPVIARLERPGANPRISTLNRIVSAAGRSLSLSLDAAHGIDETLIAASLRDSPAERLRRFESFYEFALEFGSKLAPARGS
jgi:predicted transcriptional regulator